MAAKRALTIAATLLLFIGGIFWWWPLAVLGVILGALTAPAGGIALALLLDILWGAPPGALHNLGFPWTLLAVLLVAVRYLAPQFFFSRGSGTLS